MEHWLIRFWRQRVQDLQLKVVLLVQSKVAVTGYVHRAY